MYSSLNQHIRHILKWFTVITVICAAIFVILNASYFAKLLGFYADHTFVTEQQRAEHIAETPAKLDPNTVYIPSLNIKAPIIFVDEEKSTEAEFQKALQNGVVHYPKTAGIGEIGNTYIFGHSSDFAFSKGNYKTVFALLPNIQLGAEIMVSNDQGKVFTYKVYDMFVAKKTDIQLLDQNTNGKSILTLQTSYPVGTALKRYIVKAEFVRSE